MKCDEVLRGPEALAAMPANGRGGGGGDGCGDEIATSVEALAALPTNGSGGGRGDGCGHEIADSVEGISGCQATGATCSRHVKDRAGPVEVDAVVMAWARRRCGGR